MLPDDDAQIGFKHQIAISSGIGISSGCHFENPSVATVCLAMVAVALSEVVKI